MGVATAILSSALYVFAHWLSIAVGIRKAPPEERLREHASNTIRLIIDILAFGCIIPILYCFWKISQITVAAMKRLYHYINQHFDEQYEDVEIEITPTRSSGYLESRKKYRRKLKMNIKLKRRRRRENPVLQAISEYSNFDKRFKKELRTLQHRKERISKRLIELEAQQISHEFSRAASIIDMDLDEYENMFSISKKRAKLKNERIAEKLEELLNFSFEVPKDELNAKIREFHSLEKFWNQELETVYSKPFTSAQSWEPYEHQFIIPEEQPFDFRNICQEKYQTIEVKHFENDLTLREEQDFYNGSGHIQMIPTHSKPGAEDGNTLVVSTSRKVEPNEQETIQYMSDTYFTSQKVEYKNTATRERITNTLVKNALRSAQGMIASAITNPKRESNGSKSSNLSGSKEIQIYPTHRLEKPMRVGDTKTATETAGTDTLQHLSQYAKTKQEINETSLVKSKIRKSDLNEINTVPRSAQKTRHRTKASMLKNRLESAELNQSDTDSEKALKQSTTISPIDAENRSVNPDESLTLEKEKTDSRTAKSPRIGMEQKTCKPICRLFNQIKQGDAPVALLTNKGAQMDKKSTKRGDFKVESVEPGTNQTTLHTNSRYLKPTLRGTVLQHVTVEKSKNQDSLKPYLKKGSGTRNLSITGIASKVMEPRIVLKQANTNAKVLTSTEKDTFRAQVQEDAISSKTRANDIFVEQSKGVYQSKKLIEQGIQVKPAKLDSKALESTDRESFDAHYSRCLRPQVRATIPTLRKTDLYILREGERDIGILGQKETRLTETLNLISKPVVLRDKMIPKKHRSLQPKPTKEAKTIYDNTDSLKSRLICCSCVVAFVNLDDTTPKPKGHYTLKAFMEANALLCEMVVQYAQRALTMAAIPDTEILNLDTVTILLQNNRSTSTTLVGNVNADYRSIEQKECGLVTCYVKILKRFRNCKTRTISVQTEATTQPDTDDVEFERFKNTIKNWEPMEYEHLEYPSPNKGKYQSIFQLDRVDEERY